MQRPKGLLNKLVDYDGGDIQGHSGQTTIYMRTAEEVNNCSFHGTVCWRW